MATSKESRGRKRIFLRFLNWRPLINFINEIRRPRLMSALLFSAPFPGGGEVYTGEENEGRTKTGNHLSSLRVCPGRHSPSSLLSAFLPLCSSSRFALFFCCSSAVFFFFFHFSRARALFTSPSTNGKFSTQHRPCALTVCCINPFFNRAFALLRRGAWCGSRVSADTA